MDYTRDYSLSFAYALEEAYKKDNGGFATVEAYAAHTIAAMIEEGLTRQANTFNKYAANPDIAAAFMGCNSAIEYMLWNIHSAIMAHSGIDDEFFDCYSVLIENNAAEVIAAHPELMDDMDENHWFEK